MSTQRYSGLWFPILLGLLLLLVVPAALLLLLALLGYEGEVNAWLWHNFGLRYQTYLPAWAALVLLLLPILVLLLYFLKMKRKPLEVPSTFLWRKSIEDLQVNSFFQWLRNNALLLLQLLIILVLIYTALALQSQASVTAGKYFILLIDSSASMNTRDVGEGNDRGSRIDEARRQALAIIDGHREGDVGMVIEFNSESRVRQDYTTDRSLLRLAVQRIQPTNRTTRIDDALALADSLANPRKSTENEAIAPRGVDPGQARQYVATDGIKADVHLFTDGGFIEGGSFAAGNLDLLYHRIGTPGAEAVDNVGIVDFNAAREPGSATLRVFLRVQNFRKSALQCKLELEARVPGQGGLILRSRDLDIRGRVVTPHDPKSNQSGDDLPGEAVASFDLELDPTIPATLHARLRHGSDAFPIDDEAWLAINPIRQARVLIVTPGNPVLSYFFDNEATRKVARVEYLKPEDLRTEAYARPARNGSFDLVLFDRCAPLDSEGKPDENLMPLANTFFMGDVPPPWTRSDLPELKGVSIRNPTSPHELMQGLTQLDEIPFTGAFRFELDPRKNPDVPPRTARLLECDGDTAALFLLERRAFRDLVLALPLLNVKPDGSMEWFTLWPIRPQFPLFLRNVVLNLGNVREDPASDRVRPGQVMALRPDAAVETIDVWQPGAEVPVPLERSARGDFLFKGTETQGFYAAEWEGGRRGFAVNLLDDAESNVQPRDVVQIGEQVLGAEGRVGKPRDLWKWAALAALGLLLLEWAFYHRRILH